MYRLQKQEQKGLLCGPDKNGWVYNIMRMRLL